MKIRSWSVKTELSSKFMNRFLLRRVFISQLNKNKDRELFNHDNFGDCTF